MEEFMKKLLLTGFILLAITLNPIISCAEESDSAEETYSMQEFEEVIEVINNMSFSDNQVVNVNNEWIIQSTVEPIYSVNSVYSDTKSFTHSLRVTRWGQKKEAFTVHQTVSFVINDENNTVKITSYKSSCQMTLKDFTYSVLQADTINNSFPDYCATGRACYRVSSYKEGGYVNVYPKASVFRTGNVDFECPCF